MRSAALSDSSSRSRSSNSALAPGTKLSRVGCDAGEMANASWGIRFSRKIAGKASFIFLAMPGPLSYRDAGVDIDAGDALVEAIKPFARRTLRPEVVAGIGGFGALVRVSKKYREPVLVSGTDGVGTKLKLAFRAGKHDTIGIDLVAMSVNDILVHGAEPLFFLDYFACGKLEVAVATEVVRGIARGCEPGGW